MPDVFDFDAMQERKRAYYAFARRSAPRFFNQDGSYKEKVEQDRRITFWLFPALVDTDDPAERDFALRFYAADPSWEEWGIFITSSIAANLARERGQLSPELIRRSEEHLDRFACIDGGRKPCSGANDYMFHGYNDNMPAMASRALVLSGEALEREDLTDRGLFLLETLCAHFHRRGLLSEYNSATYTPITLTALMDIAECAESEEAAEMALACSRRILLDVLSHRHRDLAGRVGSSSRAYLSDVTGTLSNWNSLVWYLSGDERLIDPAEALAVDSDYDGPVHHGPNLAFCVAQMCEFLSPSYRDIGPDIIELANREPEYPERIRATSDAGRTGWEQTRCWSRRLWSLGTASREMWAGSDGGHHHMTLYGLVACADPVRTWRDRIGFWHALHVGEKDLGDIEESYAGQQTENQHVIDHGAYHTLQKRGTGMVLGHAATGLVGQTVEHVKFMLAFGTRGRRPDEVAAEGENLDEWAGESEGGTWEFLRFGRAYVGIRMAGMLQEKPLSLRRSSKGGYIRLEMPVLEGKPTEITDDFREWLDIGYAIEMSDAEECGDFATFIDQCLDCRWEFGHCFYRNSRYAGRNGELHIVDSIAPDSMRFRAVDGRVEEPTMFEAPGVDEDMVQLFEDGRRIRQRRLWYSYDFIGSPFYESREHVIVEE